MDFAQYRTLGDTLEKVWREEQYDIERFPELARKHLAEADLDESFELDAVARWLLDTDVKQDVWRNENPFSDSAVTVYVSPEYGTHDEYRRGAFSIDLLIWNRSSTAIHDHAFAGAFRVLHGGSIHGQWKFETTQRVGNHVELGRADIMSIDHFTVGATHSIVPGPAYTHSLFHLAAPSVTVRIRTPYVPWHLPQSIVLTPSIRHDAHLGSHRSGTLMRTLLVVGELDPDLGLEALGRYVRELDPAAALKLVLDYSTRGTSVPSIPQLMSLTSSFQEAHGDAIAQAFMQSAFHTARIGAMVGLRRKIPDEDQRYFMAVLINAPNRERCLELLRARYPDRDPIDVAVESASKISQIEGVTIGIIEPVYQSIFRGILSGEASDETLERLGAEEPDAPDETRERWGRIHAHLMGHPALQSIVT